MNANAYDPNDTDPVVYRQDPAPDQCEETWRYSPTVEIRCTQRQGHDGDHAGIDPAIFGLKAGPAAP